MLLINKQCILPEFIDSSKRWETRKTNSTAEIPARQQTTLCDILINIFYQGTTGIYNVQISKFQLLKIWVTLTLTFKVTHGQM